VTDWQPIETAPKDQTTLLLVDEHGSYFVGWWDRDRWIEDSSYITVWPTHWMFLPDPPAQEGEL
jgi:hypothetical protein